MDAERLITEFVGIDMLSGVAHKVGDAIDGLIKKVTQGQAGLGASLVKTGAAMTVAGGLVLAGTAAATAGAVKLTETVVEAGHQAHVMAEEMGVSGHEAMLWGATARAVGVDTDVFAVGFRNLARNMELLKLKDTAAGMREQEQVTKALAAEQLKLSEIEARHGKNMTAQIANEKAAVTLKIQQLQQTVATNQAAVAQAQILSELGISVTDSTGKLRSMTAVMGDVADRFAIMPDGAEKTALAMKLFGRSGAELIPVLNEGRAGLQQYMDMAEKSGAVMTDSQIDTAQKAYLAQQQLGQAVSGVTTQLALALLPLLLKIVVALTPLVEKFTAWIETHQQLLSVLIPVGLALGAILGVMLMVGGALTMLAGLALLPGVFAAIGAAAAVAAVPILIALGVLVLLAAVAFAVWYAITHWTQIKAIAAEVWGAVGQMAANIVNRLRSMVGVATSAWDEFSKRPAYYIGLAAGWVLGAVLQWHIRFVKGIEDLANNGVAALAKFGPNALLQMMVWLGRFLGWWGGTATPSIAKAITASVKDQVKSWMALPGLLFQAGKDAIMGFVNGMKSMFGNAKNTIVQFAGGLVAGFKSALGIHSPSRVFMEAGSWVPAGVVRAIHGGIPHVTSAITAMGRAMTHSFGQHLLGIEMKDQLLQAQSAMPRPGPAHRVPGVAATHAVSPSTPVEGASAAPSTSGAMSGSRVEELLTQIRDELANGLQANGSLSPAQVLAAFQHLVEAAQIQRSRVGRTGYVGA